MATFNISINKDLAKEMNKKMKQGKFSNRSEFFRFLLRGHIMSDSSSYSIEEVSKDDSDYKTIQSRSKKAEFLPLKELL
ncbi:ribbon-helix-helix domain-containing protein [Patescibacteria group bacterium]